MDVALEPMPAFSSDRESILDRRLQVRYACAACASDVAIVQSPTLARSGDDSRGEGGEGAREERSLIRPPPSSTSPLLLSLSPSPPSPLPLSYSRTTS